MKNTIDKLKAEYEKNKIEILLMAVFLIAGMIINGPMIAREASRIYGGKDPETELVTEENTEAQTETEIQTETESESETEILTEEDRARLHRRMRSQLGSDFQIPMIPEEDTEGRLRIRELKDRYGLDGYEMLDPQGSEKELTGSEIPGETAQRSLAELQPILEEMIGQYDGTWSVYVKNLSSDESFVINDQPMKSASVMKLFIMGTVYKAFESGELERTDEVMTLVNDMIIYSDNEASNQLLYLLGDSSYADGIAKVDAFIQDYGFSEMTVEYNGFNNAATNTSSENYNQVSAKDCGKLLEDIYRRTWVNREVSNEMESLLLAQNTRYKIAAGLPEGVLCGNKTGEMSATENDAAIIFAEECDYILVVLSSDWSSKDSAIFRIQDISGTVYEYLNGDTQAETETESKE